MMLRLFRAEVVAKSPVSEWVMEALVRNGQIEAQGRWFTPSLTALDWYINHCADFGTVRVLVIDIAEEDAEPFYLPNQPENIKRFSRDLTNEYFVSREVAQRARVLRVINRI